MNEKLGLEPAFPQPPLVTNLETIFVDGMSKRFYAACAAMQGLCALDHKGIYDSTEESISTLIEWSYKYADELLKQEYE